MLARFSTFNGQRLTAPYQQVTQGIRTMKLVDGAPGDLNKNENAISMKTAQGNLDVVVLTNPDSSETVVQRITDQAGNRHTSWMEVPKNGKATPTLQGFEVDETVGQVPTGRVLEVETTYFKGFPRDQYHLIGMQTLEARNALTRADSVLAAFEMP